MNTISSDHLNKLFSSLMMQNIDKLDLDAAIINKDIDAIDCPVSGPAHGSIFQQASGRLLYDFGEKLDLTTFGYSHPLFIKSVLSCLNSSSNITQISNQELNKLVIDFNHILKPFGEWTPELNEQNNPPDFVSFLALLPSEKFHLTEASAGPLKIKHFHLIYDLPYLSSNVTDFITESPLPISLHFHKPTTHNNESNSKKMCSCLDYYTTTNFVRFLRETSFFQETQQYSSKLQFAEELAEHLKLNSFISEVTQYGLELELKMQDENSAVRIRKKLWQKNIYSSITASSVVLRIPLSINKSEQVDVLNRIVKINEGS